MPISLTPQFDGDTIKLDKAILLIGRHPNCDIVLLSSRKVSRMHCCIAQAGDRLLIRDLGSTNGVTVNGDRVEESQICPGDEVMIGDLEFLVGNGSNEIRTRRVEPGAAVTDDNPSPADSPAKKVFPEIDSAETPIVDEGSVSQNSEYAIVMESSEIIAKAQTIRNDSSFGDLHEAEGDAH